MITLRERIQATIEAFESNSGTTITRGVLKEAAAVLQADLDCDETECEILNHRDLKNKHAGRLVISVTRSHE